MALAHHDALGVLPECHLETPGSKRLLAGPLAGAPFPTPFFQPDGEASLGSMGSGGKVAPGSLRIARELF